MRRTQSLLASTACAVLVAAILCASATAVEPGAEQAIQAWAYPAVAAPIRAAPDDTAAAISRLRFMTEFGHADVYEVSARIDRPDGTAWLRVDVLGPPNGRLGWVHEAALGTLHKTTDLLVISRAKLRATLYRGGRVVWSAPVAIGKPGTPTPPGDFYIREAGALGVASGPYGPFAFGTSAYAPGLTDWPGGGVIGIHGTDQPGLVPGRVSHGCIRLRNPAVMRLRRLLRVGTRLRIR